MSKTTRPTSTEYYVVYYDKVIYPPCATNAGMVDGSDPPKSKKCFIPSCKGNDCYEKKPFCRFSAPDHKRKYKKCLDSFRLCMHASSPERMRTLCPERELKPYLCVSIGELTPEELKEFKRLTCGIEELKGGIRELSNARNADRYFVWSREEIDALLPEERDGYDDAQEQYTDKIKRHGEKIYLREPFSVLNKCDKFAKRIRNKRETSSVVETLDYGNPPKTGAPQDTELQTIGPPDKTKWKRHTWVEAAKRLTTKEDKKPIKKESLDMYRRNGTKTSDKSGYFTHDRRSTHSQCYTIYWEQEGDAVNSPVIYFIPNDYPR